MATWAGDASRPLTHWCQWTAGGKTCRTSSATAMSASSAAGPSSSSTPLAPSNGREAPESDGYRAIFGKDKKPIPRWVPIALVSVCAAVHTFSNVICVLAL